MEVGEILSKLNGVRGRGSDRWAARCPAHHDHRPSLVITAKKDRTLVHCWAGCETKDVVAAIGLRMADLFVDSNHRPTPEDRQRRDALQALETWCGFALGTC